MPSLHYGQTTINWQFQADAKLKRHYVTVERGQPVLLRGPAVSEAEQESLVRKRARWIREKLALVNQPQAVEYIVTGSRLRYCGRSYFTEVRHIPDLNEPRLHFTASRFILENPTGLSVHPEQLAPLLQAFYRERAKEKLIGRVRYWERQTGLKARDIRIRNFQSRWASCTTNNILEFHPRVMELASSVQDYVIVHELCHTAEKSHNKDFWKLVTQYMPNWQRSHAFIELEVFGDSV
ncbi:YgjP family zinc-dependent metalloprotease [Comamonas jiangduensis]|uniref:YgjP family zinc-dependent metalloprotease n=1 Tax=Comamonas jiangduensis TaxID=1194168 RepID=UPI0028B02BF9|nr:SprT family zinc-dependent metalloprotease [Comamonas jiangduensis]